LAVAFALEERVSALARRADAGKMGAPLVLGVGDEFHVMGVHTGLVAAEVVDLHLRRDRPDVVLVGHAVCP
jgi:hypothetical protein